MYDYICMSMYENYQKKRERGEKKKKKTFRCPWWPYECIFFLLLKKEASILE